jgi:hypothetical protein
MPPEHDYAIPSGQFYRYVWDTKGVPYTQEFEDTVIITPQFDNLVIYGRHVTSPYPEDNRLMERNPSRILGEWFSVVCPEGEVGTVPVETCTIISAEEFSAAYARDWQEVEHGNGNGGPD